MGAARRRIQWTKDAKQTPRSTHGQKYLERGRSAEGRQRAQKNKPNHEDRSKQKQENGGGEAEKKLKGLHGKRDMGRSDRKKKATAHEGTAKRHKGSNRERKPAKSSKAEQKEKHAKRGE